MFLFVRDSSLQFVQKDLNIDHQTAVDWNSFCRDVVIFGSFQPNLNILGPGITVEIDESQMEKKEIPSRGPGCLGE